MKEEAVSSRAGWDEPAPPHGFENLLPNLPGWAAWPALAVADSINLTPESLVAASLSLSGALAGRSVRVRGLEDRAVHPVTHLVMVVPDDPLARAPLCRLLSPVRKFENRLARQPHLPDYRQGLAPDECRFGTAANPSGIVNRLNALREYKGKPVLATAVPNPSLAAAAAAGSIDGALISDGTAPEFASLLLELDTRSWRAWLPLFAGSFEQSEAGPGNRVPPLTAFWTMRAAEAAALVGRESRRRPRPRWPVVMLDARGQAGVLPPGDSTAQAPAHVEGWSAWCAWLLAMRCAEIPLPDRRFTKRAGHGLAALHKRLINLETKHPLAGIFGVGHFLGLAERAAALFSLAGGQEEIDFGEVSPALDLALHFCHRHLACLDCLLNGGRGPKAACANLENRILGRLRARPGGITLRELIRSLHRPPPAASLRLKLEEMERFGKIEMVNDRFTPAMSAPTNGTPSHQTPITGSAR